MNNEEWLTATQIYHKFGLNFTALMNIRGDIRYRKLDIEGIKEPTYLFNVDDVRYYIESAEGSDADA